MTELIRYDAMCRAIDAAYEIDEVKDIRDKAAAIAMYQRQAQNRIAERRAMEIRIRAERKCGALLLETEKATGAQGTGSNQYRQEVRSIDTTAPKTLAEMGISKDQSSKWQKLAEIEDTEFEDVLSSIEMPTTIGVLRASQLVQQSKSNEHYTPTEYIEAARRVMGGIDLDPASCAKANVIVDASKFFSEEDDGLSKDWSGRIWLNPPYGGSAKFFVEKLSKGFSAGLIDQAVVLVNAHCTDTAWFQPLWDGLLCFTDHRINFYGDDRRSGSTHGSVFSYFGRNRIGFHSEFSKFGPVVERVRVAQ